MSRLQRIESFLDQGIVLLHLDIIDESRGHNVPDGSESHFKVVAVSGEFEGLSRINRHRRINSLLQSEFDSGMHALAIPAFTESEWKVRFGAAPLSPPCAH